MKTEVLVIGGGVIGTAITRELSKYTVDVTLVEKGADVACGTSKANSGIIHAGYNASSDTVKGKMNVRANPMFDKLCKDLKVPFERNGSLVVGFDDNDLKVLRKEEESGKKQNIEGLEIVDRNHLFELEPNLNSDAQYALYAPTAGIVSPYELAVAQVDNAVINGARVFLNTEVQKLLIKEDEIIGVKTNQGQIKAELVINAAGVFADKISRMAGEKIKICPRKGEYHLYDKEYGDMVNHVLFPIPTEMSKGILVTPTVHGNLLIGPNSNWINDKEDVSTTGPGLDEVMKGAKKLVPGLPNDGIITSFAGLRAAAEDEDFVIGFAKKIKGFINVAGIQSPGLSSTPAIAEKVVDLTKQFVKARDTDISLNIDQDFQETLPEKPKYDEYVKENREDEWQQLVKEDSDYGKIICRCETITKGEIVDAIHSPVPARTVDAIKRRTRAGSGRCQGGFCGPRVVQIIAEELDVSPLEVTKRGGTSQILKARSKELILLNNEEVGEET